MTSLALAIAYLGTLAALCWAWRERRQSISAMARLEALEGRAKTWNEAADYVETLKLSNGLNSRKFKP